MPLLHFENGTIFYATGGERGTPIVFVHGAGSNHLIWGNQLRAVSACARGIALDLPGHGRSTGNGRATVEAYAEVVIRVLDALAIERAIIAGHSMGGAIAQTMAIAHPDRVAGIALIGTGARLRVAPATLEGVLTNFAATTQVVVANCFGANADARLLEKSLAELRACSPIVLHGDFLACDSFDVRAQLSEIRTPTLVIGATLDKMVPFKFSEFLAAQISGTRLVCIQEAGHYLMLEQPEPVNRALVEFVKEL